MKTMCDVLFIKLLFPFSIRKGRHAYCGKLGKYRKSIKKKIYTSHNPRVNKILVYFLLVLGFSHLFWFLVCFWSFTSPAKRQGRSGDLLNLCICVNNILGKGRNTEKLVTYPRSHRSNIARLGKEARCPLPHVRVLMPLLLGHRESSERPHGHT